MKFTKFGAVTLFSLAAFGLAFGGFAKLAHAEIGLNTETNVNLGIGHDDDNDRDDNNGKKDEDRGPKRGENSSDGRMYKGDDHRFVGIVGTVTATSATTLTVKNNRDKEIYVVNTANAKIYKGPSVKTLADIKIGDLVIIEGTISGNIVNATRILDTQFDMNFPENAEWKNFKPGIMGTVSAVSGTTLTVTSKEGTVYTVATADAKFQKEKGTIITLADIKIGDTVLVQGTVNGTNVTAKNVFDTQIAIEKLANRADKDNGNHYGFFKRFNQFFRNIFKPRIHVAVDANLNHNTYRLTSYNGVAIASDQNYTLAFNDGKVSAKFCNTMNGDYSLKGGVISSSLASTMMACSDANLMTMEGAFANALRDGATLTGNKDVITLKSKTAATFVFTKQ